MGKDRKLTKAEQTVYNVLLNAAEENRAATFEEVYSVMYGRPIPLHEEVGKKLNPVIGRLRRKLPEGEIVVSNGHIFSKRATE